jgi:hypothetical protein
LNLLSVNAVAARELQREIDLLGPCRRSAVIGASLTTEALELASLRGRGSRVLEKLGMRRTGRRIVNEHPLLDYEIQNRRHTSPYAT